MNINSLHQALLCYVRTSAVRQADLVGLVQQLHPLLEDLAVVLSTLPQHLPPQLLHGHSQLVFLKFIQRLIVFYHLEEDKFI